MENFERRGKKSTGANFGGPALDEPTEPNLESFLPSFLQVESSKVQKKEGRQWST
jgi:hypothetical protein